MTNDITVSSGRHPATRINTCPTTFCRDQQYLLYDETQMNKLFNEVIAAAKDDRANTKRAISADIASTARVQNQNERVIAACERELHRKDLSDKRRDEILDYMKDAADSTNYANTSSREFQREQLDHSHKMPWKLIGIGVLIVLGGAGGAVLLKSAA